MKGRVIVLDSHRRAALMENGRLVDLLIAGNGPIYGEQRDAKISRKLPGKGTAFVEMTGGEAGFLREAAAHRAGDALRVQIAGNPEAGKAWPVTTRLLYKGPRLILTPGAPGINVSRQIRRSEEADRLKAVLQEAAPDGDCGVIIRSAAEDEDEAALLAELAWLQARHRGADVPPILAHALAEWLFPLPDRIVIAAQGQEIKDAFTALGAEPFWGEAAILERLEPEDAPFEALGIWEEIDALKGPEVALENGASMFIEPSRALVAVDVNTGGDFSPAAALKANIAALRALPRALTLRGLGGIVMVDLAPVMHKDRKMLETTLKSALKRDPVETSVAGWTGLGLMELQRKRERLPITEADLS